MIRGWSLCLAALVACAALVSADEKPALKPGNYIIYYATRSLGPEQAFCLIKVDIKDGKPAATVLDSPANVKGATVKSISADGKKVDVALDLGGRVLTLEGTLSAKDPPGVVGSFGDDKLLGRARLTATDKDKLEKGDLSIAPNLPEPMKKVNELNSAVLKARTDLAKAKDAGAKADAQKELDAAQKELNEQSPPLYKEVLAKHADNPTALDAALALLGSAEKNAKAADVTAWLKAVDAASEPYGPRYQTDALVKAATALGTQKGFEAQALATAEKAAKLFSDKAPAETQIRVLKTLHGTQEKAGKGDAAKQTEGRIAKLEEVIDKEYMAKVPPFKPTAFEGRKGKSTRVAVMELFTGSQCPPCVAADAAFDGLMRTYKPTDVVLLQYHMHIPGPDPMTNPDTEARWKYYGNLRGVPSSLFNGKPEAGGGGGMAASEKKYQDYRGVLEKILEEETAIKLAGAVTAKGDKLSIKVTVEGLKEGNDNLKLRLALAEETVKYAGSNGIRMHHQVVRAMPGGVDGMALKGKGETKTAEVDIAEVRKSLAGYLDEQVKNGRVFSNPDRPLAFKHLRVVAFVQDDNSKEILQAAQFEVPEGK